MRRRRRDIVIELTALLDVIMILIFMVMNEKSKLTRNTQDQLSQVQLENLEQAGVINNLTDQIADLSAELDLAQQLLDEEGLDDVQNRLQAAENRLEGYQAIGDIVVVLNVSLENKHNGVRFLTFDNPADSANGPQTYEAGSGNSDAFDSAVNHLKTFIFDQVSNHTKDNVDSPTIYIVFSYDPYNILDRDYNVIDNALSKVVSTNVIYHPIPKQTQ